MPGIILLITLIGIVRIPAAESASYPSRTLSPLGTASGIQGKGRTQASTPAPTGRLRPRASRLTPTQAFRMAYQDYLRGHDELAITSFQQFLKDYPTSSLVPQAIFYLGEVYENQRDLESAAEMFERLVTAYPSSRFVSSALFKLGRLALRRGDPLVAKQHWSKILQDFPRTPEARLARQAMVKNGMMGTGVSQ